MRRNKVGATPEYAKKEIKVSTSDEWRTPRDLFNKVNAEFHLEIDRAANPDNHLLDSFNAKDSDGLTSTWLYNGWVNPPYSNPGVWYRKAQQSAIESSTLTVMLVKVSTSEKYWIETVKDAHVRFLAGRIRFWDENNKPHYGATFGSALIIFSRDTIGKPKTEYWDYRKQVPERLF